MAIETILFKEWLDFEFVLFREFVGRTFFFFAANAQRKTGKNKQQDLSQGGCSHSGRIRLGGLLCRPIIRLLALIGESQS